MDDSTTSTTTLTAETPGSWLGRIPFDLTHWCGALAATIELLVRADTISVWCGYQEFAVMHRNLFRTWVTDPDGVFTVDRVTWSVRGLDICMCINYGPTYPVPRETVDRLREVI